MAAADDVRRFDAVERTVHWATAVLTFVLLGTGTVMYIPSLAAEVGRRATVRDIHVASGFLLTVPLLVALAGRWGRRLAADVARIDRWDATDRAWWRARLRREAEAAPAGKFNSGQKLNAAFVAGTFAVLLGTGSLMHWPGPFPLSWRTGATFVHDWLYLFLAVGIAGHVVLALTHPQSLRSIVSGRMSRDYAARHHPRWEPDGPDPSPARRRALGAVLGALAVGGVVLAGGVAAGALSRDDGGDSATSPAAVARRFQTALERNEIERAYNLLGPLARAARPKDAFLNQRLKAQQDRYLDPGQKEPLPKKVTVAHEVTEAAVRRMALRVEMTDGQQLWRQVELRRSGRAWHVDNFRQLLGDPCRDAQEARRWQC